MEVGVVGCLTMSLSLGVRGGQRASPRGAGRPAAAPRGALFSLLFYQAECVSHKVGKQNLVAYN